MEWLSDNLWLAWIALAMIFVAVEAATADFVFIMLAGGALAGALAAGSGVVFSLQVVLAVLVAMLLIGLVRPLVKRQFATSEASGSIGSAALQGRLARVIENESL